jgi:dihydropteroate synthase
LALESTAFPPKTTLNCAGKLVDLTTPAVMSILNLTPDSFFAGSRVDSSGVLRQAENMLTEGATFLDLGGYSTRPGAEEVSVDEELRRVVPAIEMLHREFPEALLSIDTFRARVAREAVGAGAVLINDVSGGILDEELFETVAALRVPYVLMHSRGTPKTMSDLTAYTDVVTDVIAELEPKLHHLRQLGVTDVVLDPGFGFAKTTEQNFRLLANLPALRIFGLPLLVGVSRKGMIWKTLGISPDEARNGTTVLNTVALRGGARILRVHDVREAVEAVKLCLVLG